MKITFIGLSCFLLESVQGDTLLLDPYYGDSKFGLGLKFPEDMQADVFLASHADEDHSNIHSAYARHRQESSEQDTKKDVDIFPDFNLRGTLVREWNGDLCVAYSFTIDGIRFIHLADNVHPLSDMQLEKIGHVDVVFVPMPKGDLNVAIDIIKQLNPKLAIPSHFIPVARGVKVPTHEEVIAEITKLFTADWMKDANNNDFTQNVFVTLFENALKFQDSFENYEEIDGISCEISKDSLPRETAIRVFRDSVGRQIT